LTIAIATFFLSTVHAQEQELRDPLKWPFSKTSIWNMPIHNDAVLVPANIQAKKAWAIGPTEDEDVIILTPDAPLIDMYKQGWASDKRCVNLGTWADKLPVPTNLIVKKGGTPNHSAAILMPDGETFYQTQPFDKCAVGSVAYTMYKYPSVNMYSEGVEGAHGGSALSSIGGTVRLGEVVPGGEIRHTIKINLYAKTDLYYRSNDPDGKPGYRWPALRADGYASSTRYAGTNPALKMGALLALPADFDIEGLSTEPAKIFARAFMNYGAYVVDDTAWDVWAIPTEKGSEGSVLSEFSSVWGYPFVNKDKNHPWSKDMQNILLSLHVVDNNSPGTIGGGPTYDWENRRAPMAPDFITRADSVTGVNVTPTELLLAIGANSQLTATVKPNHATRKEVSWSSSNESVATVDTNGLVQAIAEGTAIITATTQQNNLSASSTVNVTLYGDHTPVPAKIEAEDYSDMKGVQTEFTADAGGGLNVGYIEKGDWVDYQIFVPEAGLYDIDIRVSSPNSSRQLQILVGSEILATVDVPKTGAWQKWETVTTKVTLPQGIQTLRILSSNGTGYNYNLNWLEIKNADTTTGTLSAKVADEAKIRVYPNPVNGDKFIIQTEGINALFDVRIFNLSGALVYASYRNNFNQIELPAKVLGKAGIYAIEVNSSGRVFTEKIINQ